MPGSPHPTIRRRRQGSPHPIAITADEMAPASRSTTPEPSRNGAKLRVAQDNIPPLGSMAPAIFVPATFDFTKPRPSPSSSTETTAAAAATSLRVDRALADLEDHMNAVKRNISTLTLREARRYQQEAAAKEVELADAGQPPPRSKRLPPTRADEELMLQNLAAHSVPGRTYGVHPDFGAASMVGVVPHPKDTPREAVTTQILDLIRYGGYQLEGYERHCVETRRVFAARVKQDIAQEVARNLAQNQGDNVSENLPTAKMGGTDGDGDRMDID